MTESDGQVDWDAALQVAGGRRGLLVELSGIFLAEYEKLISNVDSAIAAGNVKDLQIYAHGIKGSLRYFGDSRAMRIASQLEELARSGTSDGAKALRDELDQETRRLIPEIRQFIERNKET